MIKAVIFDWDGVIVDSLHVQFETMKEICRIEGKNFPFKNIEDLRKGFIEPYYYLYESFGFKWDEDEDVIVKHYKRFSKEAKIDVFSEVIDVIRKLRGMDIFIGLASSNRDEIITHKIEELGLQGVFDIVITEEHVSRIKPDPECLNMIMLKHSLKPEEVMYLGDMPADIDAGNNAGVKSVAVAWGWVSVDRLKENNPDYVIFKPEEILGLIDENS